MRAFEVFPQLDEAYLDAKTIERAIELHDKLGLSWDKVAERMNLTSGGSIKVIAHRYKTGQFKGRHDQSRERRATIERMVAAGATVQEIARALKVTTSNLHMLMLSMGLDPEMRREARSPEAQERFDQAMRLQRSVANLR